MRNVMKYLEKLVTNFALKVSRTVIESMHDDMNLIRAAIVDLGRKNHKLPGYISIEAPNGKMAISPIVWLLPGERIEVSFYPYIDFPSGSVVKANNPFWIDRMRIGNSCIINSDNEACMTCTTTESLLVSQRFLGTIYYPKAP